MKTAFVLIPSLLVSVNTLMAQHLKESDVPQAAKETQKKMFAGTVVKGWELENGNYEAEFILNGTETSACFDASGKWMQTETEINPGELPMPVMEYLGKNFKGKTIREADKVNRADGKELYEVELDGKELLLDANGNPAK